MEIRKTYVKNVQIDTSDIYIQLVARLQIFALYGEYKDDDVNIQFAVLHPPSAQGLLNKGKI